jgi:hypothetical protein
MNIHPYYARLARALDRMGGVYSVSDILQAISENRMQGFADGDSWAVAQVVDYPRARVMDVLAVVGDLEACRRLHDRILEYAARNDITFVQAYGRRGWMRDASTRGWKVRTTSYLYQREL